MNTFKSTLESLSGSIILRTALTANGASVYEFWETT